MNPHKFHKQYYFHRISDLRSEHVSRNDPRILNNAPTATCLSNFRLLSLRVTNIQNPFTQSNPYILYGQWRFAKHSLPAS